MKLTALPSQVQYLFKTHEFPLPGGFTFAPSYIQAILMVVLLFLLILTLGQLRKRLVDWHFKGFMPGIFLGFLLTLFLEGFFVIGGKTVLTELLGWENAPKPIANVIDTGREKLVDVLGVTDEIPASYAAEDLDISVLSQEELETLRNAICQP